MKPLPAILLLLWLALPASPVCAQQPGVVDLTTLANYAKQAVPTYITRNNTPANNQITDAGATLGRVMFYDKRLSRDSSVSCGSCHVQAHAFGDTLTASNGVGGTTARHTPRLINGRFGQEVKFFWDERAPTLEFQTSQPIQNHVEMGFSATLGDPAFADLVTRLTAIPEYRVLFSMTFGTAAITETRVQQALAQFVRSIQSFDSRYDVGRAAAGNDNTNFTNFTASENNGKALFIGRANCNVCHRPPEFDIDPNSRNNGVITVIGGGTDLTNTRSPSLRDLLGPGGASNGAFMHDGSQATLDQVVNHYNAIPNNNTNLDPRLQGQRLNLTTQQHNDLVAFLKTLTGTNVYTDARWSNPFTPAGDLTLIILPASALRIQSNGNGAVTLTAKAAPKLVYQLEASTDLVTWTSLGAVNSDASGNLSAGASAGDHAFFRFTYAPPAN